jgi:signal transduction histidine kinase
MAAVGRTAAAVSHEIDNPIGIILGTAEMLRRELAGQQELTEDVLLIEAECKRCRRIVRDLLDFARPGAREAGPVDLPAVVEPLLRGLKHHPEFRGIRFRISWPEGMPAAAADSDGVKQVILNLLINAARAMGDDGEICVEGAYDGERVRVSVLDEGPGIAPEHLIKIFEPFFTTGGGSGLGLPVSRRIVEQAGGRLWAESREGGGSVFHLELPRDEAGA